MHHVRTEAVRLEATQPVELKPGVVLPKGFYTGNEIRTGETISGGVHWAPPRYTIEFLADQLASIDAADDLTSDELDVTALVRSGELIVT